MKRLSILGSTGSIGRSALRIVARFPDRFAVCALAAHRNVELLSEQIRTFRPEAAAVGDAATARELAARLPAGLRTRIFCGEEGYRRVAAWESADVTLNAVVGAAGLGPTLAAVEAGKTVAIANKETLVMAGGIVARRAAACGARLLPVDSEHSAVFQCLEGRPSEDLERILLTASGGPFRDRPAASLGSVTPEEALRHPNWSMGPKITVDSATLMNKGLEVIEAMRLFSVPAEKIEVVIHPQSIVHSMVALRDGSVMAQLGVPDMAAAIAYALSHPERLPLGQPLPAFARGLELSFSAPEPGRFPCLALALEAARTGGTAPAVLNAANEVAVGAFLDRRIGFTDIARVVEYALRRRPAEAGETLEAVLAADREARVAAQEWIDIHRA
ncbi:MAG: 1-deoxy-D-xylulose-5-phosphate reductoisomerase [Desulfobacterales bacterium]